MRLGKSVELHDQTLARLIYDDLANAEKKKPRRNYLGLSEAGEPCHRKLYLNYHNQEGTEVDGRMARLFRRGILEEEQMANDMRRVGIDLRETGENQREVIACESGAVKGHIDGIIYDGVPDHPKQMHIWECKTHNRKNFNLILKNGAMNEFPKHHAQMQCYMYLTGIDRGIYTAVCKDDDRIHTERVKLDKNLARYFVNKLISITEMEEEPDGIDNDPTSHECKPCKYYGHCYDVQNNKEKLNSKGETLVNVFLRQHRA